ncbi:MAG TPA: acylphosphatase [Planctomycetaceae bacterium]|nr:acylphosphatase [Planctomycetaceae bacterium]
MNESSEETGRRLRVIYHGRVQGVGFRFTTASLARRYPVVGYVRNVPNGTVELVVEGEAGAVDEFLQAIERTFRGYIHNWDVVELPPGERFERFEIRY